MKKGEHELIVYNTDQSKMFGEAKRVVFPKSKEEVKKVVFDSQDVVPRGCGTNIVGGCVPTDSVVMDMKNLNKTNFDYKSETVYVEPGITIKELNERLKSIGYFFPIISEGTIGGMIAMNSPSYFGGYGNILEWIEEVEIVNGRADVVSFGKSGLGEIVGMEGATGIIVGAKLKVIKYQDMSASIFQTDELLEIFSVAKRLRLEKNIVMLRFYSKEYSKILGFPSKYHIIVGFRNSSGQVKGEEFRNLFDKIRKDYFYVGSEGYNFSEDPKFLFEKMPEFVSFLEKFNVLYSGDLNLGIIFSFFNDELKRDEAVRMINRMGGKLGKYGVGIKRKKRVENLSKKILKRVKLRHDPFLKFNKGKFIDIDENEIESLNEKPIAIVEDRSVGRVDVGAVEIKDNFDRPNLKKEEVKVDRSLMDKILFNKGEGSEKKEDEKNGEN